MCWLDHVSWLSISEQVMALILIKRAMYMLAKIIQLQPLSPAVSCPPGNSCGMFSRRWLYGGAVYRLLRY